MSYFFSLFWDPFELGRVGSGTGTGFGRVKLPALEGFAPLFKEPVLLNRFRSRTLEMSAIDSSEGSVTRGECPLKYVSREEIERVSAAR